MPRVPRETPGAGEQPKKSGKKSILGKFKKRLIKPLYDPKEPRPFILSKQEEICSGDASRGMKDMIVLLKDKKVGSEYRLETFKYLMDARLLHIDLSEKVEDAGIAACMAIAKKRSEPVEMRVKAARMLLMIEDNPKAQKAGVASCINIAQDESVEFAQRIDAAQILLNSDDEATKDAGVRVITEAKENEALQNPIKLPAAIALMESDDERAREIGTEACIQVARSEDLPLPKREAANLRIQAARALLFARTLEGKAAGIDVCMSYAKDTEIELSPRIKALRALFTSIDIGGRLAANEILNYYESRLYYSSKNLEEMQAVHRDAADLVLGIIVDPEDLLHKQATWIKLILKDGLVNEAGHLTVYGIHNQIMAFDEQEVDFAYAPDKGLGLLKPPDLPKLTEEQAAITHNDLKKLVKKLFDKKNRTPKKREELASLLMANKMNRMEIKRQLDGAVITSWLEPTEEGVSLNRMQRIARLVVDFLNQQVDYSEKDELSPQASQTFQLLKQLMTCKGGKEQGMRAFYEYMKQVTAGGKMGRIDEIAVEDLAQKRFRDSLEDWREGRVLAHVEAMVNGHEAGKDTFMDAIAETPNATDTEAGTPHEATYLRNVIGKEIGLRLEKEGLNFDANANICYREIIQKSKQELLDIFMEHFEKEFTIEGLSKEFAEFLTEELQKRPIDADKNEKGVTARMRYEGVLQGIFTPNEISYSDDKDWFTGRFDDDIMFIWTQIDSVTPKGAEAIMKKLGWIA